MHKDNVFKIILCIWLFHSNIFKYVLTQNKIFNFAPDIKIGLYLMNIFYLNIL